jgi:hypothetical protein
VKSRPLIRDGFFILLRQNEFDQAASPFMGYQPTKEPSGVPSNCSHGWNKHFFRLMLLLIA